MKINVFFDDEEEIADVIAIPDFLSDIGTIQENFFAWMFDKNNNHVYWVCVDNEKKYCEYGIDAFVEWLNNGVAHLLA